MKKPILILITIVFFAGGCGNRQVKTMDNELVGEQDCNLVVTAVEQQQNREQPDENQEKMIEVNYASNKELLDIILLLPDTVFSSWGWGIEDRKKWYNEIKSNNFWIDKDPFFFNQSYLNPNNAGFQIVDGFWKIALYKTFDNSFIVITDDIVGDGNEIYIFEVKDNKIIENLKFESVFGDYRKQIKLNSLRQECNEKFEELEDQIFTFHFNENTVEIESSWYLTKEEYKDYLTGNSILYKFNAETKKFEMDKIYWKPKKTY